MWRTAGLLAASLAACHAQQGVSSQPAAPAPHAVVLEVKGAIGPATHDFISRSLEDAREEGASLAIIRLDTPGGLVSTTRDIISLILDSTIPVAVHVAPDGARAASAGTFLVYASHVAAMAPATHLGAATPVSLGGPSPAPSRESDPRPADDSSSPSQGEDGQPEGGAGGDAMSRKVTNDAAAYLRSLAELRGRNVEWAEKAVREGATLTAWEALELEVIDHVVADVPALLEVMHGRTVRLGQDDHVLDTRGLSVRHIEPDWRTRLLSVLANPNVAYILLLVGIYGLIFEFSNPGALIPGIAGAICLLVAFFALQLLPLNYAGLALLALGLALMIAEAIAPGFGVLGAGGLVAFVLGSILLIDTDIPEFRIHWSVVAVFAGASALMCFFVLSLAVRAWRRPVVSGDPAIFDAPVEALESFTGEGWVRLQGESWKARTQSPVKRGDSLRVRGKDGLLLEVEPAHPPRVENRKPRRP